jgi:hypothetical protein
MQDNVDFDWVHETGQGRPGLLAVSLSRVAVADQLEPASLKEG